MLELRPLAEKDLEFFCARMQAAFQQAVDTAPEHEPVPVLPRSDIDESLRHPDAVALAAWCDGAIVGGTVVFANQSTGESECALLYVDVDHHNHGLGPRLWAAIEEYFPHTRVWKLCTPYFEKRNIRFYLRKCGFHITDLYEDEQTTSADEEPDWMFSFEKRMDSSAP